MTICDLCEGRRDVTTCRVELPLVKQAGNGTIDLCMACQEKIYAYISASVGVKIKTDSLIVEKGPKA